jgi:hypothetical protein
MAAKIESSHKPAAAVAGGTLVDATTEFVPTVPAHRWEQGRQGVDRALRIFRRPNIVGFGGSYRSSFVADAAGGDSCANALHVDNSSAATR